MNQEIISLLIGAGIGLFIAFAVIIITYKWSKWF